MLNGDMEAIISALKNKTLQRTVYRLPFKDKKQAKTAIETALSLQLAGKEKNTEEKDRQIERVAEWMYSYPEKWLFMHGLVGTGKTTFLKAVESIYNEARFTMKKGDIIRVEHILAREFDIMDEHRIDEVKKAPILAIDDFGLERLENLQFGNIRSISTEVLEYRYDKRKLTLFTTNFPFKDMEDKYGLRIHDRLREMVFIVTFTNDSYRHE